VAAQVSHINRDCDLSPPPVLSLPGYWECIITKPLQIADVFTLDGGMDFTIEEEAPPRSAGDQHATESSKRSRDPSSRRPNLRRICCARRDAPGLARPARGVHLPRRVYGPT